LLLIQKGAETPLVVRAIVSHTYCLNNFLEFGKNTEAKFATCKISDKRNLLSFLGWLL
jgi:hypothetical protein